LKVSGLVAKYSTLIRAEIAKREKEEVERLEAEYADWVVSLKKTDALVVEAKKKIEEVKGKTEKGRAETAQDKLVAQRSKIVSKLAERDEKITESRRRAQNDRNDVEQVGKELVALYADDEELLRHARLVGAGELEDNEFNLNVPRYVDTFEPEKRLELTEALISLRGAESSLRGAMDNLNSWMEKIGYGRSYTN